jgi:hypothetical protein
MTGPRLLIVGNSDPIHVGAHFLAAAESLGLEARICDVSEAYTGPALRRRLAWWLAGRRPVRLDAFGAEVVETARAWKPDCVLATGIAPLAAGALRALGALGVKRFNFLTDDPWNRAHRASWFLDALPHYDHVFSPRAANLADLRALVASVSYLPFAYAPGQHFIQAAATGQQFDADVLFAGGADEDRVRAVTPFIDAGLNLALYGGYWTRYRETKQYARGHLGPVELRHAVSAAKVCLCLVRRANRDGHSMRSFEVPAMGGCMLVEDTPEHRAIFGDDDAAVVYFESLDDGVARARALVSDPARRQRLASAAHALVSSRQHTYADRLRTIVEAA